MSSELKLVVRRIYSIAQDFYNSDIHTHIQAIYNRLNDEEQNTFLKGLIPFLFDVEEPPKSLQRKSEKNEESEFDVETFNQVEMIKLKSWIVKTLTIVASSFFLMIMLYVFTNALIPGNTDSLLRQIVDFVLYVIKF